MAWCFDLLNFIPRLPFLRERFSVVALENNRTLSIYGVTQWSLSCAQHHTSQLFRSHPDWNHRIQMMVGSWPDDASCGPFLREELSVVANNTTLSIHSVTQWY